METNPLVISVLAVMGILLLVFVALHWRFHPRQTTLDSFEALNAVVGTGKPVLVQFHAPL